MSSMLYRLGRAAYRGKGWVLLGWGITLALVAALAGLFGGTFDNSFKLPGTQSQQALDQLSMTFPEVAGTSATLVVVVPDGRSVEEPQVRADIETTITQLDDLGFVESAASPYDAAVAGLISEDGQAAIVRASMQGEAATFEEAKRDTLRSVGSDLQANLDARLPGSTVSIGGEAFGAQPPGLSPTEGLGLVVALIVLVLTLGSLAAAMVPLVTAVIGVGISMALIVFGSGLVSVSSTTPMLAIMLGLAVGIDYALFILSRHREQLAVGLDPQESAARATATSGSAVVFAGLTVIVALVGLVVAGIPFLSAMGIAAAGAVAIAVLIALTALPAFMGLAGDRLRPRSRRQKAMPDESARAQAPLIEHDDTALTPETVEVRGFFGGWVRLITKAPLVTIVLVVVGLGALALPARDLQLALPDAGQDPPGSSTRVTYDLLAEHFGPGFNGPLIVTAEIVASDDPLGVMDGLKKDIEAMPGVAGVPLSTPNRTADTGIVQVVPTTGPQAEATSELVRRLRDRAPQWQAQYGVSTAVTGFTAVAIDISDQLAGALLPFGVFVVGLSLILLTMVFRSIAVPIKATLGYLISVLGSFGAIALVFEHGYGADLINLHDTGPVISFLPIILMGILFGLAMDYEVFLVSRMREDHVHGVPAKAAVQTGFVGSGRVVLAAALIMFAVFAFFVPHGSNDMKSIAFGLAVGVAIDAFIVRMTLVPAVMSLLGERAWWLPGWIDRHLPSFDVEGASLHRQLTMADWPTPGDNHAIYAEGLRVSNGGTDLFCGVDVRLCPGEVLVVEGEPAARMALLMALSGRLATDAGQAKVAGMLLPEQAGRVRRLAPVVDFGAGSSSSELVRAYRTGAPVLLVDVGDAAHSEPHRTTLAAVLDDLATTGIGVLIGVSDVDSLAGVLPARHDLLRLHPVAVATTEAR